ncbi:MAG: SMP-30/gluconolactonase/LRE family protein [Gammaproteobacteria bacterium]|nr:SMP-30/gluconolactonase/LRE family protein [Gammaproteobacteria bacterium]
MHKHRTQLLVDGFVFLEGPRWHQGHLWFSDMWAFKVYKMSATGVSSVVCEVPQRPSGLGFLPDGTLLVVSMADRKIMKLVNGKLVVHAELKQLAAGDVNDVVTDAKGRTYAGNFGYDLFAGAATALADLILVEPDGKARVVAGELDFPNGTVIKDGGKTLVVAETWAKRLSAFDIAADGSLSNRRVYATFGERMPDGICLDAAGGIWVSCFNSGEFIRVLEGGEITDLVELGDKRAVACQLGGDDGKTLFCLTYDGQLEDIHQQKAAGAVETVRVTVGSGGSP